MKATDSIPTTTKGNKVDHLSSRGTPQVQNALPEVSNSVFDIDPDSFTENMDKVIANRNTLFNWVENTFVKNVDFMHVSFGGKTSDKPSLLKGGAEKVCSALNIVARFPNLHEYEKLAMGGAELKSMVLRCELYHKGTIVGEGAGGRNISQDRGDLNKYLKMCIKSAFLDATIRTLGMSAMFTQDGDELEEEQKPKKANKPQMSGSQKNKILDLASTLRDEAKRMTSEKWLCQERTYEDAEKMIARLKDLLKEEQKVAEKSIPKGKMEEYHNYLMDTASGCWMMSQEQTETILNSKVKELEYGDTVSDLTEKQVESFVKNITDGKMIP